MGTVADIRVSNLGESRWAVVINALEDAALIQAVWPLVEHRMAQMGLRKPAVDFRPGEKAVSWMSRYNDGGRQNLKDHWGQIPPVLLYRPGERPAQWLARHGVAVGPVDPRRGVPFYLLLVGRPGPLGPDDEAFLPHSFQYLLDIFWGVGRLCFTDESGQHRLADYTAYAERVVAFEQAPAAWERLRREIVYFATAHSPDLAMTRSLKELARPLATWAEGSANLPARNHFAARALFADEATKSNLFVALGIDGKDQPPALLVSVTQSVGLPPDDPRLPLLQGALVTQDWSGVGPVNRDLLLTAEDIPERARLDGMFAVLIATYSLGCPDLDEFIPAGINPEAGRVRVAPFPLIAQLPQRMLARGALGVLGNVDRMWVYAIGSETGERGQSQPYKDVLGRLIQGRRVGDATDQFNVIQGDRAFSLTEELENIKFGKIVDPMELARLWMARGEARMLAWLGDPACRLPVEGGDLPS